MLGFSARNLWNMREFYIRMTKRYGWTKNVLIHQLKSSTQPIGVATYKITKELPAGY